MNFFKNLKIAYWATFKPDVFDAFIRMYLAREEYQKKSKAHAKCKAEQSAFNIATIRFNATLKG